MLPEHNLHNTRDINANNHYAYDNNGYEWINLTILDRNYICQLDLKLVFLRRTFE
jgi:hypothetical protein